MVTMTLSFLETNGTDSDISRVKLFAYWTDELARREHIKNAHLSSDIIMEVWRRVAWQVYQCRRNSVKLKDEDLRDDLQDCFSGYSPESLLQSLVPLFERYMGEIRGTFHEQFMEYLVAEYLINACIYRQTPYPEFLSFVLRPEINRYFRSIWVETLSRKKKTAVCDAIEEQYFTNIGKRDSNSVGIRVHSVYHLCRLEYAGRNGFIERAFDSEKHTSVLLSLYFGAVKLGDLQKEKEFYERLSSDSVFSRANRGYHLVYYADMIPRGDFPYLDDNTSNWEGTLTAIVRHFDNTKKDHFFLRRIDLFTIRELMTARKLVAPLTEDLLNVISERIRTCEWSNETDNKVYSQAIQTEFDEVKKVFERIQQLQDA